LLLGGLSQHPRAIYESAIGAAKAHLLFRPMNKDNRDILLPGKVHTSTTKSNRDEMNFDPRVEHDACFVGGTVGIGAQIFNRPEDLPIARKLVEGCIWAYESMPAGIMPDSFHALPCEDPQACDWNTDKWHAGIVDIDPTVSEENVEEKVTELRIPPGVTDFPDRSFRLRYVLFSI
jgi:mannosyl-oligosaccharide alpha-1,2-mannosidase